MFKDTGSYRIVNFNKNILRNFNAFTIHIPVMTRLPLVDNYYPTKLVYPRYDPVYDISFTCFLFAEFRCYKKLKKLKSRFEANPMFEFMHDERTEHREKETKHMFKNYVKKHGKNYKSDHEHARRRNLFRHNAR